METKDSAQSTPTTSGSQWRQVKNRITQERNIPETKLTPLTTERTCSNCNTIIDSTVLEQCPLCMHELSPLPPKQKETLDRMLFTGKKLISEKEIRIDRNKWTSGKEIFNVFLNSVLFYIFITLGATIFLLQGYLDESIASLLYLAGSAVLGVYSLIYVGINHLKWKKIGFKSEKILLYILLGIAAGIGLYFVEYGVTYLTDFIPDYYADKPIMAFLFDQSAIFDINTIDFPLRLGFYAIFLLEQVMEELLFRGVVHNGIYDVMKKKKKGGSRFFAVLLTTLFYASFYMIFEISGYMLIFNLVLSLVIGIVYELSNRSLTIVISMKIIYVGVSILLVFIPLL